MLAAFHIGVFLPWILLRERRHNSVDKIACRCGHDVHVLQTVRQRRKPHWLLAFFFALGCVMGDVSVLPTECGWGAVDLPGERNDVLHSHTQSLFFLRTYRERPKIMFWNKGALDDSPTFQQRRCEEIWQRCMPGKKCDELCLHVCWARLRRIGGSSLVLVMTSWWSHWTNCPTSAPRVSMLDRSASGVRSHPGAVDGELACERGSPEPQPLWWLGNRVDGHTGRERKPEAMQQQHPKSQRVKVRVRAEGKMVGILAKGPLERRKALGEPNNRRPTTPFKETFIECMMPPLPRMTWESGLTNRILVIRSQAIRQGVRDAEVGLQQMLLGLM